VEREPIFNVPASVLVLLALLALVHAGLSLLPATQMTWTMLALAFIPARCTGLMADLPGGSIAAATSFLTYQVVHADLTHLLVNSAWLLAFGSAVAMRFGGARFVVFTALCGIAGAVAFLFLRWGEAVPVVGASGAVSGLMAASLRFLFGAVEHDRSDRGGAPQLMPLARTLVSRRILTIVAVWMVVNFIMAAATPATETSGGIAWQVHLGGFLFGLLACGAFERPNPAPQSVVDRS